MKNVVVKIHCGGASGSGITVYARRCFMPKIDAYLRRQEALSLFDDFIPTRREALFTDIIERGDLEKMKADIEAICEEVK